ncbi:MAG: AbrB/MazE/SpoVT family DNA-binding domain-containing protein [Luteolibacter sp.]
MKTVVSSKGQIVLPSELRRLDDVKTGNTFEVERLDRGEYRLKRVEASPNEGLVDWLLACPAKGFLSDGPREETTDAIQPDFR